MKAFYILLLALTVVCSASAQIFNTVDLRYKIGKNDTLRYKTIMNEVDSSLLKFKLNWGSGMFTDSSEQDTDDVQDFLEEMNEAFADIEMVTELSSAKPGIVDIVMKTVPNSMAFQDTSGNEFTELLKILQTSNNGVMLRGSVYEHGSIHSFWTKTNQKNLIAMMFELPAKPVAVGDTWSIDISFINNDQNYICDSASKTNQVHLSDIRIENGETIAVIEYHLQEYVNGTFNSPFEDESIETMMYFRFNAVAEFNVDRGYWKSFDGLAGLETTGYMETYTNKKFALIPLKE